ncbi:MAG: sigma-70 family RNA polymerase sigma factor [Bdellovibrionaceae bacterium]|nr:sigma-70 family RNA polymerase sigma factor [Pseudobdellovibrionaceae bacterium]
MKQDLTLIEEVKEGNIEAFSELVLRHQRVLLRMAMRVTRDLELAEDIVQESFMKAYKNLNRFEGRASFKSWIYQIALNTAKNKLRSNKYNHINVEKINLATHSQTEGELFKEDIKKILNEEIDKLPDKQRLALTLRIYEDLSFKEISEIMDCPYDTAKANYRHALMKLRHRFEDSENLKTLNEYNTFFSVDLEFKGFTAEVD